MVNSPAQQTSIQLTATTNAANASFSWSGPNGFNSTNQNPTVTEPGVYQFTVTNNLNECLSICEATVTQDVAIPACSATGGQLTCTVTSIQLTATTDIPNPTFSWSGPNGFNSTDQNPIVNEIGAYTVIITNPDNGCTNTCDAIVTQNINTPSCVATGGNLTCTNTSVQLMVNTNSPNVSFDWSGPNDFNSSEQNPTVNNPGNYTIVITNLDNGCTSTCVAIVTQDINAPSCSVTGGQLTCNNPSLVLGVVTDAVNATYSWTGPNSFTSTNQNPSVSQAGTYSVEITNVDNGCTSTCQAIVEAIVDLTITCSATPVLCNDENGISSDGTATVNIIDSGTGALTYLWDDPASQTTATATNLAPGTYTVTVADAVGCTASCTVEVENANPLTISCSATAENCDDLLGTGADDGTATVMVESNGAGGITYEWDDPANQTTATAIDLSPGNYSVTVTDLNDCIAVCGVVVDSAVGCRPPLTCIERVDINLDLNCKVNLEIEAFVEGVLTAYDGEFEIKVIYAPGDSSINEVGRYGVFQYEVYFLDAANPGTREFICSGEINVRDTIRPTCIAPNDAVLDCEEIPFDLPQVGRHSVEETEGIVWESQALNDPDNASIVDWLNNRFNDPSANDNCGATAELIRVRFFIHCKTGYIEREFRATDICGNQSINTCKQKITIKGRLDYCIKFPKDVEATCGENFDIPGVEIEENGCDLLSLSVNDENFNPGVEAGVHTGCYKIFRTYRVINWCQFDGAIDPDLPLFDRYGSVLDSEPLVIGRDEDCDDWIGDEDVYVRFKGELSYNGQLTGTTWIDADCDPWNDIPRANKGCRNPWGHWEELPNYISGFYQYTQVVKVTDNIPPELTDIGDERFPSFSTPLTSGDPSQCIGQVNRMLEVFEDCTPMGVEVESAFIRLDPTLDLNPVVLVSRGSLTDGAADFNFEIIDENPKFTFSGQFPIGSHSLTVKVVDGCGTGKSIVLPFEVYDGLAPAPICRRSISLNLMRMDIDQDGKLDEGGMAGIWAMDFIASEPGADCSGLVNYTIEKAVEIDAGAIPDPNRMSINFDCSELGENTVYVYAWDGAGNFDRCETIVIVKDLSNICPPVEMDSSATISGAIFTEMGFAVTEVEVEISGNPTQTIVSTLEGIYTQEIEIDSDYTVTPNKDIDHTNGVTTQDLIQISDHILGRKPLDSAYELIAADVNKSGSITTLDLIQLRKLILRIDREFSQNTSWRFIDAAYVFPDATNPWTESFPEIINLNDIEVNQVFQVDFIGVKIGDVTNDVAVGKLIQPREIVGTFNINLQETSLESNQVYEIAFKAADLQKVRGYQFSLQYSKLIELIEIQPGLVSMHNFGTALINENIITTSWFHSESQQIPPAIDQPLFTLKVKANSDVKVSEVFTISPHYTQAEAYNSSDELLNVALSFNDQDVSTKHLFELGQNQPNPFKEATVIPYSTPEAGIANLYITDMTGKLIQTFTQEAVKGKNRFELDRQQLPLGVLYYRLELGDFVQTKRMVHVK